MPYLLSSCGAERNSFLVLIACVTAIPVVKIFVKLAMTLVTVRIIPAVRTAALVANAAPHRLMIAAELVLRFVSFEVMAPRL